jgi:ribose 5-phosphate isomerase
MIACANDFQFMKESLRQDLDLIGMDVADQPSKSHAFALHGGTNIGTTRKIASYFGTDVIIIGGYEAYITAQELSDGKFPIPVIVIPATLSNNLPDV